MKDIFSGKTETQPHWVVMCCMLQSNTMAFCAFCDNEKNHLPSEIPTIQHSGKLCGNKGFLGGISQSEHFRKDPPRNRGSAWQHKHEADPALESDMNDSVKTRDAIDHNVSNSAAARRCPEAKLAVGAAKEVRFLLRSPLAGAGFFSPGRAGSAGISSDSAPGQAEISTRAGLENGSEDVPNLHCISASHCPGLPYSGESCSMQLCSIFQWPVLPGVKLLRPILINFLQEKY